MRYSYICIEGVIGAGKTSLASRLAAENNARLILEQFEDNPFLPKFYKEPEKYAFPLELSFLASRFQQLKDQLSAGDLFRPLTIADYFIQKSLIFARKTLKGDELALYSRLFNIMAEVLPGPEMLVYLHLDVEDLKANIVRRGRDYEQEISLDYLARIQQGYFDYIRQRNDSRILILDTSGLDFVNSDEDYFRVKSLIEQEWPVGIHRLKP
jgi:deoxyadenosine/deoxycytidine kinase